MFYENLCMNCMKEKRNADEVCPYCGFDNRKYAPLDFQLSPYTTLSDGRYVIGKVLGTGGFGITYIAFDTRLEIPVAIKELFVADKVKRKHGRTVLMDTTENGIREYREMKRRFMKEAQTMAELENVEGVVKVKDYFTENDTAYIVMEYLDGKTLKEILEDNRKKMTVLQTVTLLEPVMHSLTKMHKAGIIHRDISLDNIMVTKDRRVKLIDLGGEKRLGNYSDADRTTAIKKSVYTPVEQILGKSSAIGPWTDVYALAVTIYRCICGTFPKAAGDRENDKDIEKPSKLGVRISKKQEETLLRALAIDQKKRIQTVDQLLAGLKEDKKNGKWPFIVAGLLAIGMVAVWVTKENVGKEQSEKYVSETKSKSENETKMQLTSETETDVERQTKVPDKIEEITEDWYYIASTYKDGIAVRSEPSENAELLTRVPYETEFCVNKYNGNWGYTTVNGVTGWILLDYARVLKNAQAQVWYRITSTYEKGIAVRREASEEAELLTRIPYGTEFYVEKTDKNWGYTTVNGVTGWILLDYADIRG